MQPSPIRLRYGQKSIPGRKEWLSGKPVFPSSKFLILRAAEAHTALRFHDNMVSSKVYKYYCYGSLNLLYIFVLTIVEFPLNYIYQ